MRIVRCYVDNVLDGYNKLALTNGSWLQVQENLYLIGLCW